MVAVVGKLIILCYTRCVYDDLMVDQHGFYWWTANIPHISISLGVDTRDYLIGKLGATLYLGELVYQS